MLGYFQNFLQHLDLSALLDIIQQVLAVLLCLMLYAVLWQCVLKKFPLTTAFANKAIVVVWGIIWGWLWFEEAVTWNKVVGAAVIIAGILIVVRENNE